VLRARTPAERALVLLYCPAELRKKYLDRAGEKTRKQVLEQALELGDTSVEGILKLDQQIKQELSSADAGTESVTLQPLVGSLVQSLPPEEEIRLLREMKAKPKVRGFLRTYPSFAFADHWPDETLALFLATAQAEDVVALVRLLPELAEKALSLCPPMTAELAKEELERPDSRSADQKARAYRQLKQRLKELGGQIGSFLGKEDEERSASSLKQAA
jgi:hypothetical protein